MRRGGEAPKSQTPQAGSSPGRRSGVEPHKPGTANGPAPPGGPDALLVPDVIPAAHAELADRIREAFRSTVEG
jgi:hypothetical protein